MLQSIVQQTLYVHVPNNYFRNLTKDRFQYYFKVTVLYMYISSFWLLGVDPTYTTADNAKLTTVT